MFSPDPSKETIEICFYHKQNNENYPLGLILDSKLDFSEYIEIYFIRHNKKKNKSFLKYLIKKFNIVFLIVLVFLKNLQSHLIVIFYVLNNTFFYTQLIFFSFLRRFLLRFFLFFFLFSKILISFSDLLSPFVFFFSRKKKFMNHLKLVEIAWNHLIFFQKIWIFLLISKDRNFKL